MFLNETYTSVDAGVAALVNSRLPIAKGERGQLREHGERYPEGLSSDSKEVLAMSNSARPFPTYLHSRLPWESERSLVPPRGDLR